ncbi:Hypothetical secreted protein OS=uncultured planctomycete 6FN GN=6FN_22 PE=4 SV=1 [Gemmataceae bacterium]|nr:Hypothetical secreted protein OS=uncultured planctomycete 6FN GN=6FN_22 PE=4 SV=1 [Gemmataceae bacterium]VTU00173.1 Hypothetical secreted protein OS=uncultured planctomycete 6FN GN=6FN_22 PE=4 SV=1 [Gemmataceae bacterium]
MTRLALAAFCALALASVAAAQEPDLSGRWSGYWVSDKNGHTGPLHARFRQLDADTYRVAFRGRFAKVIPFWYTTKLRVEGTGDGVVALGASQRLPLLGEYRSSATATGSAFGATFSSRRDSGRFVLERR